MVKGNRSSGKKKKTKTEGDVEMRGRKREGLQERLNMEGGSNDERVTH